MLVRLGAERQTNARGSSICNRLAAWRFRQIRSFVRPARSVGHGAIVIVAPFVAIVIFLPTEKPNRGCDFLSRGTLPLAHGRLLHYPCVFMGTSGQSALQGFDR